MKPGDVQVEWQDRTAFAQLAEALGVTTDSVMAAYQPSEREWVVLYTDEPTGEQVHKAAVWIAGDGVMEVASTVEFCKLDEMFNVLDAIRNQTERGENEMRLVLCPRCAKNSYTPYGTGQYRREDIEANPLPALSRVDNATYICSDCGVDEAIGAGSVPVADWPING